MTPKTGLSRRNGWKIEVSNRVKNARDSYAHALTQDLKENVLRYRGRDGEYRRLIGETLELQKHEATELARDLTLLSLNVDTLELYDESIESTEVSQTILRFRKLADG
jgi:hypothetical protein